MRDKGDSIIYPKYHSLRPRLRLSFATMTAVAALLAPMRALAGPSGGTVVDGGATISQSGAVTNVHQSTNSAIINWRSFSVASGETVNFLQPGALSVTLNRVIGNESSVIAGALNANGRVFLVNSNGILFAKDAQVNVGGLVASTLDISDKDFKAGNYIFSGSSTASVVNQGNITAADGGSVALLGRTVSNEGVIAAKLGSVALASGEAITLNFGGDSLVDVTIDKGTLNALVENKGAIKADGGQVILTAKAADAVLSAQVNNSGIIRAQSIADLTGGAPSGTVKVGKIKLIASNGTTKVTGTLDASAPDGGKGGTIETSGSKVVVDDAATITTASASGATGDWIIDPDGYTIGVNGDTTGAALTSRLAANNVTILSTAGHGADGNIYVNDAVSWSANTLTLSATNNVFVNSVMTATGTASFAANYGSGANADLSPKGLYFNQGTSNNVFAGQLGFSGSGTIALNGVNYTVISTLAGLAAVKSNLSGNYVLGTNVSGINATSWAGAIGDTAAFTGNFNGLGHLIMSPTLTATGLFGTIGAGAIVSNLGIRGATIVAGATNVSSVGVLANVNNGTIVNSYAVRGSLTPRSSDNPTVTVDYVGGLVGDNAGLIAQSFSAVPVLVTTAGGGLVGHNEASGVIVDSAARDDAYGSYSIANTTVGSYNLGYVGGLVGVNDGLILRSYAGNQVRLADATSIAGGFVGLNTGAIDQSYSALTSSNGFSTGPNLAGFVGRNTGTITNAYATSLNGTNSASSWSAGFAYQNAGVIRNAYAIEASYNAGSASRAGFVADNTGGTLQNAYWSGTAASGATVIADSSSAKQLTAAQAATYASYAGFDASIWAASYSGFPILALLPVYVSNSTTSNYGQPLFLEAIGLQGGGGVSTNVDNASTGYNPFTISTSSGYVDAGVSTAASVFSSYYKNIKGVVTVTPRPLTVSGVVADKIYDGTTAATLASGVVNGGLIGLVDNQTLNVTYTSAVFADKNAGTSKTVNIVSTAADGANGGKASNYTIAKTTTAAITPKPIDANVTAASKVYDGTTAGVVTGGALSGVIAGDSVSLDYSKATGQFVDKNVGQGKTVSVLSLALAGANAGNYTLNAAQTTADITPLALTLYGAKPVDGSATIGGANIGATNLIAGDTIGFAGSVKLSGSGAGVQTITDVSGLFATNPNYTLSGATGAAVLGSQSLALDHVASGSATIASSGATTTITTSDRAIIDWYRFSIAAGETVDFVQPATTSIVLNRVTGNERSVIAGALEANGRVFIVNSAGIMFAPGSTVNVGALVASTLNVSDANFNAGNYAFASSGGSGSIYTFGDIAVADGGFLALASGNGVYQFGKATARGGAAIFASANRLAVTTSSSGLGLDSYSVGDPAGTLLLAGSVNVSGANGQGGLVETAGGNIVLANAPNVGTGGLWSYSLPSITIGSGGLVASFVTDNLATRNFSLNALSGDVAINDPLSWAANTKLTLSAAKNINVDASITATGASAGFAMNYGGDYAILTPASYSAVGLTAPANAVYASVSLTGASASLAINGTNYTLIRSLAQLDALDGHDSTTAFGATAASAAGNYALTANLDASGINYADALIESFSGAFTGLGHTISNMTISSTATVNGWAAGNLGLIGQTAKGSVIRDIGVLGANVSSTATINGNIVLGSNLGALIGTNQGNVSYAYSSGQIVGSSAIGGLIGQSGDTAILNKVVTTISNSFSTASVSGNSAGGLVGSTILVNVAGSHASGAVTSQNGGGGLIGHAESTNVYSSYATGKVDGGQTGTALGGLIGYATNTYRAVYVDGSYATGEVDGATQLGGLIGYAYAQTPNFTIGNSYASGKVKGYQSKKGDSYAGIGGLVGSVSANVSATGSGPRLIVANSHASGDVSYSGGYGDNAGGLIGNANWTQISNSYATGNVTGGATSNGTGGLVGGGTGASITKSYATGNVSGNSNVGGLSGMNGGPITDSYTTGNVTGTGQDIGGVVGNNTSLGSVQRVYATGSVTGLGNATAIGGIAGANGGYISSSYFAGVVTGPAGASVGGVVGSSYNNTSSPNSTAGLTENSYFNAEINPNVGATGAGSASARPGRVKGETRLSSEQMKDVSAYINGTISKVLAARADAAAAAQSASTRQAAAGAANVIGGAARESSGAAPNPSSAMAGKAAFGASASPDVAASLSGEEPIGTPVPAQRARRASASAASQKAHRNRGAGYGGSIQSIEVDGQKFKLDGDHGRDGAPAH